MPVLSGTQIEMLAKLLVAGFDKVGLRRVVQLSLETRLDAIVNEDQRLEDVAFELVNWADKRGRSALTKLLQGVVTVRPDDAAIRAFCDDAFRPDEIRPLDSGVLVDRVNRGIEALVALKDLPIVQQTVGQFRADFEAASKQIQILKKYKSLHDGLHRLQLKIGTIEEEVEAAKTDKRAARSLTLHAIELAPLAKKARLQAQGLPGAQNEIGWINDFDDHITTMNRASAQPMSSDDLEALVIGLNQLLQEGPRINSALANAASTIPFDNLVQAMTKMAKHIQDTADPKDATSQQITGDLTALSLLQPHLVELVDQHFEWQWVDKELAGAAKLFYDKHGPMGKMPKKKWPQFRARFIQLCDKHPQDVWSRELKDRLLLWEHSTLSPSPTTDEIDASGSAFDEFHSACEMRFFEVDDELNALSGRLTELAMPLNSLMSVIKR
ncbi:effector-associated domain EAD1-containing protein [Bradyrhizobium sp. CSS354]|uniref:effector-associated domain EAD1-containing protein n=1 Tax=Bradyrhizobium sp. CSS354 TaxID=2699172 RepID=UPI0023B01079|nr:effector-associated domain EAD1-containing protein [Bradyrhizobium sp. CSS354]MDE5461341.1 hypothetical protein [Bradyrhizobium sp. CSS354]